MLDAVCLILGGGKGTRLLPLTEYRSKPAVPVGGKYRSIRNGNFTRLPVQLKEDSASSVGVGITDRLQTNNQRLARFNVHGNLFTRLKAKEEMWSRQDTDI